MVGKRGVAVISMGLTPVVASEFLLELEERGVQVDRALLVCTGVSVYSYYALRVAFGAAERLDLPQLKVPRYVELNAYTLDVEDILRPEDSRSYRTQFAHAIRTALKWAGGDPASVYVCVAGGRKTMPIDATLVAWVHKITNVYHVVAPTVPGIQQEFTSLLLRDEEFRNQLKKYHDKPKDAPIEFVEKVAKYCFPPADLEYYIVRIPDLKQVSEELGLRS